MFSEGLHGSDIQEEIRINVNKFLNLGPENGVKSMILTPTDDFINFDTTIALFPPALFDNREIFTVSLPYGQIDLLRVYDEFLQAKIPENPGELEVVESKSLKDSSVSVIKPNSNGGFRSRNLPEIVVASGKLLTGEGNGIVLFFRKELLAENALSRMQEAIKFHKYKFN
jgi:hypothetical protein